MKTPQRSIVYYDSHSVLVINQKGKIRRIYTPFRVRCLEIVDELNPGSMLFVDEVLEDLEKLLLYKINGNVYPYGLFSIEIKF